MEKDIAIGTAGEASVSQAAGKLGLKADVSQPVSVDGDVLGSVKASVDVEIDEVAVLKHFAAKYSSNPIVQEGLNLIIGALQSVG